MNSKDITIILPIHDVKGNFEEWFDKSIKSISQSLVKPNKLIIVCKETEDTKSFFDKWTSPTEIQSEIIYNNDKSDFCSQVNIGVEKTETEFFSILEHDDEYSNIWFKQFEQYSEAYPDVDIFFPLVVDTDEQGQFIGFTNEALWAMGFSEELGFLDNNTALKYQNFQVSGAIIRKESFDSIGGLKPSIKLTFNYEFILRATYNDVVIMTIPKVGYKHTNQRVNSLFWNYKFKPEMRIGQDEAKFWIDLSKKEYFFTKDRNLEYTE